MSTIPLDDPCPCGFIELNADKTKLEPIKFRNCCYKRGLRSTEDLERIGRLLDSVNPFSEPEGILVGKPIITLPWRKSRVIRVGETVTFLAEGRTFHEFLVHNLKISLGWTWGAWETEKPLNQRHLYLQWLYAYTNFVGSNITPQNRLKNNLYSVTPSGLVWELLLFAWDVFVINNSGSKLSARKVKELRDEDKFQSTRYEIAVAATFVRAGYSIEWLDDTHTNEPHGEFIATDSISGQKIAVEAKTRHRPGTYYNEGKLELLELHVDVIKQTKEALYQLQNYTIPTAAFIDVNLPRPTIEEAFKTGWVNEVKTMVSKQFPFDSHPFKKCSLLVFTNYAWHYDGENETIPSVNNIHMLPVEAENSISEISPNLLKAIQQYGHIPNAVWRDFV